MVQKVDKVDAVLRFRLYLVCFVVHADENVNCATLEDKFQLVQVHFLWGFSGIRMTSPLLRYAFSAFWSF